MHTLAHAYIHTHTHQQIATMTKSPFPLIDQIMIMIGPLLACLNIYAGTLIPELYVITIVAVS